ncbi:MAG: YbjN domain-containing protein [Lachnospiraceae bacterium]|nr:YbjN domain-containing protein [Lachnospiraceae bacterium]
MKLVRCENGHFYDQEKYEICPHCNANVDEDDDTVVPYYFECDEQVSGKQQESLESTIMNDYLLATDRYLWNRQLNHRVYDIDGHSVIEVGFKDDNLNYNVRIYFTGKDDGVSFITDTIAKIPKEKLEGGYKLMNLLNTTYRFVVFTVNSDREIVMGYDMPAALNEELIGEAVYEILVRISRIIELAYPEIMKNIWSTEN